MGGLMARAALAVGGLDPRGPVRSKVLAVGAVAVVVAFGLGFISGAWYEHGRYTEPPPEIVRVTATPAEETATGTASPSPADPATPHSNPTPVIGIQVVEVPVIQIEYRYIRCVRTVVWAQMTGAERSEAAVVICP